MLIVLGVVISVLIGFVTVNLISARFTLWEKIGLSFPLGIAIQTFLMLLLNFIGLRFTVPVIIIASILLLIALLIPVYLNRQETLLCFKESIRFDYKQYNLVWLFFVAVIVYFEYMNFVKCMYFPVYDRDSIAGFDTIGYIIAQEHTLRGLSVFDGDYISGIHNAGSYITYIPMVQLSYAYVYLLGAETSKIIPGLMYLFFLIAFYAALRRVTGRTSAIIATFFMMISPEMIAFSSLSITNVIQAVYASLGIIYISLWFRNKEKRDLYLGGLLLAANLWCRTEGIVFVGAAICAVGIEVIRSRQYKDLIPVIAAVTPALVWTVFMKINGIYAESIAILHPFWDAEKASVIFGYMKQLIGTIGYYGVTFAAFLGSCILNGYYLIKKKDNLPLLFMTVISLIFYVIVLYQIDYKWDTLDNVMMYSAKRFLFCFVPLCWYFAMTNEIVSKWLGKLDDFLSLEVKKQEEK